MGFKLRGRSINPKTGLSAAKEETYCIPNLQNHRVIAIPAPVHTCSIKEMQDSKCCSKSSPRLSKTATRLYVMDRSFSKKFGTPLVGSILHSKTRHQSFSICRRLFIKRLHKSAVYLRTSCEKWKNAFQGDGLLL